MPSFSELRAMYDRGETQNVLDTLDAMNLDAHATNEESQNLATLRGWCHYRRKEFQQAYNCAVALGTFPWARELMAYLCAYVPHYVNDQALLLISQELGSSNINVANAFIIRARASDCSLLKQEDVHRLVVQFTNEKTVHGANLLHNAGRYSLEKGTSQDACEYLESAIIRYETLGGNFHHRAAANFWKSQAYEKMGNREKTIECMEASVNLWEEQCKLDPSNKSFAQKSGEAKKRLTELTAA